MLLVVLVLHCENSKESTYENYLQISYYVLRNIVVVNVYSSIYVCSWVVRLLSNSATYDIELEINHSQDLNNTAFLRATRWQDVYISNAAGAVGKN